MTPFASILQQMRLALDAGELRHKNDKSVLTKIYFFFICREPSDLQWFDAHMKKILSSPRAGVLISLCSFVTGKDHELDYTEVLPFVARHFMQQEHEHELTQGLGAVPR